jgi:predicted NUDIX family phosphoesterase
MVREIMVVERKILLSGDNYFEGFRPKGKINYESIILNNFKWMERSSAEENPDFKQPIAYSLIVNPSLRKVFAYQRSLDDKKYSEKRLQGKWSWGVGGHINKIDIRKGENPIYTSMLRELREEIKIMGVIETPIILGYINQEDKVGGVHFGLLSLIETNAKKIIPLDPEIKEGGLKTISELEEICNSSEFIVEGWSRIALEEALKGYFLD